MNTDRGRNQATDGAGLLTPAESPGGGADPESTGEQPRETVAARVRKFPAGDHTRTVVLVLHGGRSRSTAKTRPWQLAYARMIPLARAAHRALPERDAAVWLLRNRVRGWNEPRLDPVVDAGNAIAEIRRQHPGARIVLVGHSMGARTALRLAGEQSVTAVCALAPWIESGEPIEQLSGRSVLIAHGDRDHTTCARTSNAFATRAQQAQHELRYVTVNNSGHAMLRRARVWKHLVRDFVAGTSEDAPEDRPEAGE